MNILLRVGLPSRMSYHLVVFYAIASGGLENEALLFFLLSAENVGLVLQVLVQAVLCSKSAIALNTPQCQVRSAMGLQ